MQVELSPSVLRGTLTPPPSKSLSHRMLICAALAGGTSRVENLDYSVDVEATIGVLRRMGAGVTTQGSTAVVAGCDPFSAVYGSEPLDFCESGSTLRLLIPLLTLAGREVWLTGRPRLFARPHTVYRDLFARQNLAFEATDTGLRLHGAVCGGDLCVPGDVSSQFISGLLLALPLLSEDSVLSITPPFESRSYVELTRQAQRLFGVQSRWRDENELEIPGGQRYTACACRVESDWSQAAVPAMLAAVRGGITLAGLTPDSLQGDRVILSFLERCGAACSWRDGLLEIAPPAGGLRAPGDLDLADCPDLGPIVSALGLFCHGETRLVNAGRLRIKESDRIASVQEALGSLGGNLCSTEDTLTITGPAALRDGTVAQGHNDHRVVMALAATALAGGLTLRIDGAEAVRKSWPGFFEDVAKIGAKVAVL